MKKNRPIPKLAIAAMFACGLSLSAQNLVTWTGTTGDFYDPTKWDTGAFPTGMDYAVINNGGTATIGATAGNRTLGLLHLGYVEAGTTTESGHIIMNGGTLTIGADDVPQNQVLIGEGTVLSTFIQNGGTIMLDAPETGAGNTAFKGVNEIDWEVGLRGMGRFEMHNDAKFFASDDLKVAENAAGNGYVLMDGNSFVAVGSGVSISSGGGEIEQTMVMAGNSRLDSGNSMGAGSLQGGTDEGYLTMAIGGGKGKLTVQDNAQINIRRLSAREGTSTIIVKNNAQFHIFDVLNGAGTNAASRPPETGPNSTYGSAATSVGTFVLQDDAVMTVNSDPASGPTKGLGISAQRDGGNAGGKMTMTIRDRASLTIEQDFMLGTGADSTTSDGTLEVIGPAAQINIKGNLNMAVDLDGNLTTFDGIPAKSTLSAIITGPTHTALNVGGIARIANGNLKVTLNGYSPAAGTTYTLIDGGTVEGQFASTDFTGATLGQGLGWQVEYAADAVRLKVLEQPGLPVAPQAAGLITNTPTVYVNTPDILNNGRTESLGIAIASNNRVIVGWEDDAADDTQPNYLGAVWTAYGTNGARITQPTLQTSIAHGGSITHPFLSYFRADGTAVPGFTSWGPKIKANLFGDGYGMGATSYQLGLEVPQLAPIENNAAGENAGDYPTVQLMSASGAPIGIVSGVTDAHAETPGNIRIGDWDYLSTGNIVIFGESRQSADLVDKFGGSSPATHVIYRIVTPAGAEVKGVSLASSNPDAGSDMWHGSGVVRDGFGVRFGSGGAKVRLFDNAGNPTTENIDLATLTGHAITSGGGRGDGVGFHGNGKDAYAALSIGNDDQGVNSVYVTVLNTNGTLRYSKSVSTGVLMSGAGRGDVAIDESGRVLAVWDALVPVDDGAGGSVDVRMVLGRLLDPSGNPIGGTFYVSEKETPNFNTLESRHPRVAIRGGVAAVTWQSLNAGVAERVVALRVFQLPTATGGGDIQLSVAKTATGIRLAWTGGNAPFVVQRKTNLTDASWTTVTTTSERTADVAADGSHGFFQISSSATP